MKRIGIENELVGYGIADVPTTFKSEVTDRWTIQRRTIQKDF
jgi:hypothetical protein